MRSAEENSVLELIKALLHCQLGGGEADLLLYEDVQRAVMSKIKFDMVELQKVLDQLCRYLATAVITMATHTDSGDPLQLWSRISQDSPPPHPGGAHPDQPAPQPRDGAGDDGLAWTA